VQLAPPVSETRLTARVLPISNRWVLLALQLPAQPSKVRVRTWRRLQQLGAVPVKHAVYVLPNSAQGVEDFAWLRGEIESAGGQATVFTASAVEDFDDADIIRQFKVARAAEFKQVMDDIRRFKRKGRAHRGHRAKKELRAIRDHLDHAKAVDFFAAPGSADAEKALTALEDEGRRSAAVATVPASSEPLDRRQYAGRIWVTRPRPGVDRFASAWLIRRFIDAEARFTFATTSAAVAEAVPFDMYDGGFKHEGEHCTFEVLAHRFAVPDAVVRRIGEIVHDVDLKDDRFHAPQAPAIAMLVAGLRASIADDHELLRQGMAVFEALYHGLKPSPTAGRPSRKRVP
jgi:hypothetical protein